MPSDDRCASERPGVVVVGGSPVWLDRSGPCVPSGFLRYLDALADELGHVTFFAAVAPSRPAGMQPPRAADPEKVTVCALRFMEPGSHATRLARSLADARSIRRAVAKAGYAVHFFPAAGGPLGSLAIRMAARGHLTYLKSDWIAFTRQRPGRTRPQAVYWAINEQLEARLADAMVFRSTAHRRRLAAVQRGVSENAQPLLATAARNEAQINRTPRDREVLHLLFVGNLYREKGLAELVAALRIVEATPSVGRLRLTLAGGKAAFGASHGDQVLPDWLSDAIQSAHLRTTVTATGHIDDPAQLERLYRDADVFVLPSWTEGFPRVLDEAMSYGIPVVTTAVGGIPDVLTSPQDALLVEPRSSGALAEALVRVLGSSQERSRLITASRRSFEARVREGAAGQHARLLREAASR